jgi:hypothetical protein
MKKNKINTTEKTKIISLISSSMIFGIFIALTILNYNTSLKY